MDHKAFSRAKLERDAARTKLGAMEVARNLQQLIALWSEFLTSTQRCFTKLRKATEHGPSKGWFDHIKEARSNDELLTYVLHARNADEHGIDPITAQEAAGIGIGPKIGNALYIDHMRIDGIV